MITAERMKRFAPLARAEIVKALVDGWPEIYAAGVNSPRRLQHFMAQIATETGGLRHLEENLNYSAERLVQVWPSRFPNVARAAPYAHNPQKLANKVYGGRMGNVEPDDGWRYRGGGMAQTTGRDNYRAAGHEFDPDALRSPGPALTSALKFWKQRGCGAIADRDDVKALRRAWNGGLNGLAECEAWLVKARGSFPSAEPPAVAGTRRAPAPGSSLLQTQESKPMDETRTTIPADPPTLVWYKSQVLWGLIISVVLKLVWALFKWKAPIDDATMAEVVREVAVLASFIGDAIAAHGRIVSPAQPITVSKS